MPFTPGGSDAVAAEISRLLAGAQPSMPTSRGTQTPSGFAFEMVGAMLADASSSPTLAHAYAQFNDVKATKYVHHFTTEPPDVYFYDCVGFTGYTVREATPVAWRSLAGAIGLHPGFVPKPATFAYFLDALKTHDRPGWRAVPAARDIRAGDIIAWQPAGEDGAPDMSKVGHAVIPLTTPRPIEGSDDARWEAVVMDSTASPHGPCDTRQPDNPLSRRNLPTTNARGISVPSGLGIGTMAFSATADGRVVGIEWSVGRPPKPVVFGAGRATH
jgi:hypothetical protein